MIINDLPSKETFLTEKNELLRPLYVVACINSLSPAERKAVFSMFNLVLAPRIKD